MTDAPVRDTAEVVIVGGGIEGLSTAVALARRGVAPIVVVERATLASGFTALSSGIVRCHYGVPTLAAMAWRGVQVMEQALELLGDDIGFHPSGYLLGVGPENADALRANIAMHRELGIEVAEFYHDRAGELVPHALLDDFAAFANEPRGGFGDAFRTAMAFGARARDLGVSIRQGVTVTGIRLGRGGAVEGVATTAGPLSTPTVVVAAGPWSPALVAPLGIDLPIRAQREQIVIVDPGRPLPPTPVLSDLVTLQYVRTEPTGEMVVGNSDHRRPEYVDPDDFATRADDDFLDATAAKMTHRYPRLVDAGVRSTYAGCYDVTPDFNPVIGPAPGIAGLHLCAGFSGHGFKIAPAVGELVADLVLDGASGHPDIDGDDFRLDRFDRGELLVSRHPYVGAGQMR